MSTALTIRYYSELEQVEDFSQVHTLYISYDYSWEQYQPLIQQCTAIQHLVLGEFAPLSLLNKLLFLKASLRCLEICYLRLESFPKEVLAFTKLEELSLEGCQLADPQVDWTLLTQLPYLRHLNLHKFSFSQYLQPPKGLTQLTALRELIVPKRLFNLLHQKTPEFCQQLPYLVTLTNKRKRDFNTLLKYCRAQGVGSQKRAVWLNLLDQQLDKLTPLATPTMVLEATDLLNLELLRLRALEYFQEHWGATLQAPLPNKCLITVAGTFNINKNQLRRQLKEQGIQYKNKLSPQQHYLLLGQRSKGAYLDALKWNIPILTEKAIIAYLDQRESAYLTQNQEGAVDLQHLEQMLCSTQVENVQLALTLFEQGGFPKQLLTALFWAHHEHTERKIRRHLERLLGQHVSIELMQAIRQQATIFHPYSTETTVLRQLKKLEPHTELDVIQLAHYGYQRYKKGLVYLLKKSSKENALALLNSLVTAPDTLSLVGLGLSSVPPTVFEMTSIQHLDLSQNNRLKTISIRGLKKLSQLKHLYLNNNSKLRNNSKWVLALAEELPQLQVHYYKLPH